MQRTIEEPDFEIVSDDIHKDTLKIFIREKEVVINVCVDCCGNTWAIDKKELLEKLK